jgi:chromosome segregation ATPase
LLSRRRTLQLRIVHLEILGLREKARENVFTSAFALGFGIASASFAMALAVAYFVIIQPRRKRARDALLSSGASEVHQCDESRSRRAPASEFDQDGTLLKPAASTLEGGGDMDLESLMSAVRNQAVELRGEHAKAVSKLSLNFDLLTNRLSTIDPLLTKAMEAAGRSEASVNLLTGSNAEYKRKLAEAERDLETYRPLALKLEDDLRIAQSNLAETDRRLVALENEHAVTQGAHNDLFQKMASAELARERTSEENNALAQKLNEHEATIQSLLRETANLKSETVSLGSDLERAEQESKSVADKYATEREANSRAKAALNSLETQFKQFRKDAAAQLKQVEERELASTEALSVKEKQFYDSEIKRSALDSKLDFLTRTNQRLREDLRRSLDHVGNLEASNRKLLDLLARNSAAEEQEMEAKDSATADRLAPKLRAVAHSQVGKGGTTKSGDIESESVIGPRRPLEGR